MFHSYLHFFSFLRKEVMFMYNIANNYVLNIEMSINTRNIGGTHILTIKNALISINLFICFSNWGILI